MQKGSVSQSKCQSQTSNIFPVNTQPRVEGRFLNLIPVPLPSDRSCPYCLGLPGGTSQGATPPLPPPLAYSYPEDPLHLIQLPPTPRLQLQEVLAGSKRQAELERGPPKCKDTLALGCCLMVESIGFARQENQGWREAPETLPRSRESACGLQVKPALQL